MGNVAIRLLRNTGDPNSILPTQGNQSAIIHRMPEARLMLAVLNEALLVIVNEPDGRERRNARKWVASTGTEWPFDFENICSVLELDTQRLRAGLLCIEPKTRPRLRLVAPRQSLKGPRIGSGRQLTGRSKPNSRMLK